MADFCLRCLTARCCLCLCCCRTEHQYTEANLSFEQLKGNDRAMARALSTCPGIDAHLVLVTQTVCGGAEYSGCGYKRRCWYSESESEDEAAHHDMVEVGWDPGENILSRDTCLSPEQLALLHRVENILRCCIVIAPTAASVSVNQPCGSASLTVCKAP